MGENLIAVTVARGAGTRALAELAAETCRRRTGLKTIVVGEELLPKYGVPAAPWLICHLFDEFPGAGRILYFDAASAFLAGFDFREVAAARGLGCVREGSSRGWSGSDQQSIPEAERFDCGLMVLDRGRHGPLLRRTLELWREGGGSTGAAVDQYLNLARLDTGTPAQWLDPERFCLDAENRPWNGRAVHAEFRRAAAEDGDTARALMLDWILKSHLGDHNIPVGPLWEGNALAHAEAFIEGIGEAPEFSGRGITICAGGAKYFPCAWVCVRMLRELGCELPVQVWHLGSEEMDEEMKELLGSYGVDTVDAYKVRQRHPVRLLAGWEVKSYAIIHSPFREVLALDADNVVVRDPTYLFDSAPYHETGAVFWPDYGRLGPEREIWKACGVAYRDEPEFETGQVLVDKQRCWRELQLTMHYNEHSDFYYRLVHGDKETFHLAWRKLGTPYSMVPTPIENLGNRVMCQHDFDGRRVFQHRNLAKWTLEGRNRPVPGFRHERRCLELLEELRAAWKGRPAPRRARPSPAGDGPPRAGKGDLAERLVSGRWLYERDGRDRRPIVFARDGSIAEGAGEHEKSWKLSGGRGGPRLLIRSAVNLTCSLEPQGDGSWAGEWLRRGRTAVKLRWLEAL